LWNKDYFASHQSDSCNHQMSSTW